MISEKQYFLKYNPHRTFNKIRKHEIKYKTTQCKFQDSIQIESCLNEQQSSIIKKEDVE